MITVENLPHKMVRDMTSLKGKLSKLKINLPPGQKLLKCPSRTTVRTAFKKLLVNHPDKGGQTAEFQNITEAYREIMEYISANPDNVEDDTLEKDEDVEHHRMFTESKLVHYKDGSVTFNMTTEEAKKWMQSFDIYFEDIKAAKSDTHHGGFKYTCIDWKVPGNEEAYGSLHLSIWPTSKNPSVMVQGSHYLAFVALTLPRIDIGQRHPQDQRDHWENS